MKHYEFQVSLDVDAPITAQQIAAEIRTNLEESAVDVGVNIENIKVVVLIGQGIDNP